MPVVVVVRAVLVNDIVVFFNINEQFSDVNQVIFSRYVLSFNM